MRSDQKRRKTKPRDKRIETGRVRNSPKELYLLERIRTLSEMKGNGRQIESEWDKRRREDRIEAKKRESTERRR